MSFNYLSPITGTWAAHPDNVFHAGRPGGRQHSGNDLNAPTGSAAVAAIGGTVQYAGKNTGYDWNAVVLGDDGNAYRYATHGPLAVRVGQRVEAGQKIGTIASNHLHFEVIPPTSAAYKAMLAHQGAFVSTQTYPGRPVLTVDPMSVFGTKAGQRIVGGAPISASNPLGLPMADIPNPIRSLGTGRQHLNNGPEVTAWQNTLASRGYNPGAIDGSFGPRTETATKAYQTKAGLPADGVVGPLTRSASSGSEWAANTPPAITSWMPAKRPAGGQMAINGLLGLKPPSAATALAYTAQKGTGSLYPNTWGDRSADSIFNRNQNQNYQAPVPSMASLRRSNVPAQASVLAAERNGNWGGSVASSGPIAALAYASEAAKPSAASWLPSKNVAASDSGFTANSNAGDWGAPSVRPAVPAIARPKPISLMTVQPPDPVVAPQPKPQGFLARMFPRIAQARAGNGFSLFNPGGGLGSLFSAGKSVTSSPVTSSWTQPSLFGIGGAVNPSGGNQYAFNPTGPGQGTYFVPNANGNGGKTFNYGGIGSYAGTSDNRWS